MQARAPSTGGRSDTGVPRLPWPGCPQGQHLGGDRRGRARRRAPSMGRNRETPEAVVRLARKLVERHRAVEFAYKAGRAPGKP